MDSAYQSLITLFAVWIGILSIHLVVTQALIYLFQIKEYRFDRFFSQMREEGVGFFTHGLGRRGALSKRNILISIISFILFIWLISITYILLLLSLFSYHPAPPFNTVSPTILCCASSGS